MLVTGQIDGERVGNLLRDRILHAKHVGELLVELVAPQQLAVGDPQQPHRDSRPISRTLNAAFQDRLHRQLTTGGDGIVGRCVFTHRTDWPDDDLVQVAQACNQRVGHSQAEVLVLGAGIKRTKRQNGNRPLGCADRVGFRPPM